MLRDSLLYLLSTKGRNICSFRNTHKERKLFALQSWGLEGRFLILR
jgi:hypothetical protein